MECGLDYLDNAIDRVPFLDLVLYLSNLRGRPSIPGSDTLRRSYLSIARFCNAEGLDLSVRNLSNTSYVCSLLEDATRCKLPLEARDTQDTA